MEGRGLRYFVEVVRQGGFTRAAASLNVTQPAISKMIRQLEEQLGASLLIRNSRGIRLTEAGRLTYERGRDILEGVNSLKADLEALKGLTRGTLRLGLPPMTGGLFFPSVLMRFRQLYPDVSLTIAEWGSKRILELVIAGEVDAGVTLAPFDESQLDGLVFAEHKLMLVVPRNSQWARRNHVELDDLAEESFVMPPDDFLTTDWFRSTCRTHGFTLKEVGHSGQWDFLCAMVEAGLGITVIPVSLTRAVKSFEVKMVPLVPSMQRPLVLAWRRNDPVSPALKVWVEVMRDVMGLP